MKGKKGIFHRRGFLQTAVLGAGLGVISSEAITSGGTGSEAKPGAACEPVPPSGRLPREVWIASISQNRLEAKNYQEMIRKMLVRMEEVVSYQPDIICLPEVFPFVNLAGGRPALAAVAEAPIGPISRPFAEFARKHRCYVICPIYTKQQGRYYNSAVVIDRAGEVLGEYHKIRPTIGEMEKGIMPGPIEPPVFRTDFGTIGVQICFDIEWPDGWRRLRRAGAELVFWTSAFAGGQMVNTAAWQNKYAVVSSTRVSVSKICDISGETVAATGRFAHWVCAPINLEKVFLHTWPYNRHFKAIQAKYGRKLRLIQFHDEEWTILESRSPDVKVADVLKEFEIKTHEEHIHAAEIVQKKYWK